MHVRLKPVLLALLPTLVLACSVGAASARTLSVSNSRFRIVWTPMTFRVEMGGARLQFECDVTLEGSLHSSSLAKVADGLIGHVTRATVNHASCNNGEFWFLNGTETLAGGPVPNRLPWHVQYVSFAGTLPNITGVTMQYLGAALLARFSIMGAVRSCLYVSNTAFRTPFRTTWNLTSGRVTGATLGGNLTIFNGSELCPVVAEPVGTGIVTLLGAETSLTVTLI